MGIDWHKDVETLLRILCIRNFKLAWSPRMEQDIFRTYSSWADVYRQKEKFWRLVNAINADEKAAGILDFSSLKRLFKINFLVIHVRSTRMEYR